MDLKIKNWNDLIKVFNECEKKGDDDTCENCILYRLYGEWDQEEIASFSIKRMKRKKENACFLIAHKDQNTIHSLEKIKQLILFLE